MSRSLAAMSAAAVLALSTAVAGPSQAAATTANYIVVLEPEVSDVRAAATRIAAAHGGHLGFVYDHVLHGFSIEVPVAAVTALARSPRVAYVERDQQVSVAEQTTPTGVERIFAPSNANLDIDQTDDVRVDADVAVIDTGIDLEHPDLNVADGVSCLSGQCVSGGDDDHYHGTHVAGTVGALDNGEGVVGVAPGARLWPVKVLDSKGSGSTSGVIAGIDWVAARAGTIEVANMSLGGSYSRSMNQAVADAVAAGVTMVVAAGNSDADASKYSPASEPTAITVSALADFDGKPGGLGGATCRSDVDDTLADFSNFGTVVDIIAPGVCIRSTYPIEKGGYATISGTSMASPHVAGAAALLRSTGSTHADTQSLLLSETNLNWNDNDDPDGVTEGLLDVSNTLVFTPKLTSTDGDGGTDPANQPPTAAFSASCSDLTCSFDGTGSTDDDGTIQSHTWDFGDGSAGTGTTSSHGYGVEGTYTVTLTVTDDDGATDSTSQTVTVTSTSTGGDLTFAGSATNDGSTWSATVAVTGATDGQEVTGSWNIGGTPSSCTPSGGACDFTLSGIRKKVATATWTHDQTGTMVTIAKP